ncbi:MAG: hypothetical protein PHS32_16300 [Rhodoferax sp.]|uniref:hypothetical protein n=1 Tax=Rhodoferax sp. TaxID=50421 RepID=UPI002615BEBA|nr:hypothetical protein [Rhodoferax sp.]MDD5335294.1 hypothetical protein [Rhodoferax sp.]
MNRKIFLSLAAVIALGVGSVALLFPADLLASKGTVPSEAANVWMREVGVLLLSLGVIAGLMRGHADSPTLKTLMLGNLLVQLGLFLTEIVGYANGVITKLSGVLPSSALNLLLAAGFAYFWVTMGTSKEPAARGSR